MENDYLIGTRKQFEYYKLIAELTFEQLEDEQLFHKLGNESNSIGIIVKHLTGNMLSRFTDFLTTDGEKHWRDRDNEFEGDFESRDTLMRKWTEGWVCVYTALDRIENINDVVYIRNESHTVYAALNRQLAHYAYHVGQIVFIGKCLKGESWKSLSIPKNQSSDYNARKFAVQKNDGHYTDDFFESKSIVYNFFRYCWIIV